MTSGTPGPIALLGSGETAPTSGVVYDYLVRGRAAPVQVALLETPAGFQPNAAQVAAKVAEFIAVRLQNLRPQMRQLPARARGTPYSPDDPASSAGLRDAELIFLGPGSPTYTVRQLAGSLAWQRLIACHRHGAAIATASAATIAMGALALPVYEIYKVGADLHWQPGLNLLAPFGLEVVLIPHWNNNEGGAELDTSRCYMGQERYERLAALIPPGLTVVGIDEHTGLVLDFAAGEAQVLGRGGVSLIRAGDERRYERKERFSLGELGPFRLPGPAEGIPAEIWSEMAPTPPAEPDPTAGPPVPDAVLALLEERQGARARRDWAAADTLRRQIADLGWAVKDTPGGQVLERLA